MKNKKIYRSLFKAYFTMLLVSFLWYWLEYNEFGELQWDRGCDNVVTLVYMMILWYLFYHKKEKDEKGENHEGFNK